MAGGAPKGNQNAVKGKIWSAAILRALDKRGRSRVEALNELAEKLLSLCESGELSALKELGDRLEGKSVQSVDLIVNEIKPRDMDDSELTRILAESSGSGTPGEETIPEKSDRVH